MFAKSSAAFIEPWLLQLLVYCWFSRHTSVVYLVSNALSGDSSHLYIQVNKRRCVSVYYIDDRLIIEARYEIFKSKDEIVERFEPKRAEIPSLSQQIYIPFKQYGIAGDTTCKLHLEQPLLIH